ncbi:hypothetical protein J2I47_07520 [Fibrella sp. HMF5335]|uniref:Uncharacterized protein n=1 Tax=Fibrella rubiginis TaxID=2817060 RepID=A0A939GCG5_9BACT|nr:hypothetical protein [Fibrella rubiginis]MBO0936394.1 hypothetical protein [Fibrella rubiginis]
MRSGTPLTGQLRYRWALAWFAVLLNGEALHAYNYQEHKDIGNAAFTAAFRRAIANGVADSLTLSSWLTQYGQMAFDSKSGNWYFPDLSHSPNQISYGELNALSGDHSENPLQLQDGLRYRYSATNRAVQLQNEYGNRFYTNAPNKQLFQLDHTYGFFAIIHFLHFYAYGRGLTYHLSGVKKSLVESLQHPSEVERVFAHLNKSNALEAYVTLHALAIHLAQQAGASARLNNVAEARSLFYYALLFNAYADHFIEDACAAGHLMVRRSFISSATNNKAMHDFFNRTGLKVMNLAGETWTAHGDDHLNASDQNWREDQAYSRITDPTITLKYDHVIRAVTQSVYEVWTAFAQSKADGQVTLLQSLPPDLATFHGRESDEARQIEQFYVTRFAALTLIPVPFGSDLSRYVLPDSLKQLNQLPYFRQHIIRRVANSAKVYVGALSPTRQADTNPYVMLGARYFFSPFTYTYRDYYRKRGSVDRWFGMTTSLARGYRLVRNAPDEKLTVSERLTQWQVGVYHKADIWVTNDRYMGLNVYVEGGGIWYDGKLQAVFSPTARVELFPLLLSARKNMSKWLSIPYMILRPLSFTYSRQFTPNRNNSSMATVEIDLTF